MGKLPTNCLSVFAHFVGLALKGLKDSAKLLAKLTTDIRNLSITQTRNQEFFRAGKFSWNWGTSINDRLQDVHSKKLRFSPLETLKNCTLNEKFHPQISIAREFFPKISTLFSNFRKKGRGELPPFFPLVTRLITSGTFPDSCQIAKLKPIYKKSS